MLSSRRAMSRSMVFRFISASPAEHEVLVSYGEMTIGFLIRTFYNF